MILLTLVCVPTIAATQVSEVSPRPLHYSWFDGTSRNLLSEISSSGVAYMYTHIRPEAATANIMRHITVQFIQANYRAPIPLLYGLSAPCERTLKLFVLRPS